MKHINSPQNDDQLTLSPETIRDLDVDDRTAIDVKGMSRVIHRQP